MDYTIQEKKGEKEKKKKKKDVSIKEALLLV